MESSLTDSWVKHYLAETMENPQADVRQVIKGCSETHFAAADMKTILTPFVGSLEKFRAFLETEWSWKITIGRDKILADENKESCVCPLVAQGIVTSGELCRCSEGFAEQMFSFVLGRPVTARVVRSYLRDKKSCQYTIDLTN